jgi:hypothetical protein
LLLHDLSLAGPILKTGNPKYPERYLITEPFYNGFPLVPTLGGEKVIVDEREKKCLNVY